MKSGTILVTIEGGSGMVAQACGREVRLHEFPVPADAAGQVDPTTAVVEALASLGLQRGASICLGVPSDQVMPAPVATDGLPRKGRRALLVYRMEEHLPMDAEELSVDFLPAVGGRALGVAVETAPLRDLVNRLEASGVEVESIVPTSLLVLWQLVTQSKEQADFFILGSAGRVDIFRMTDGRPVSWHVTSLETADVCRAIHVDLLATAGGDAPPRAVCAGSFTQEQVQAIASDTGLAVTHREDPSCPTLASQALAAGQDAGWINLRRGGLAPTDRLRKLQRPLKVTAALALALVAVVTGGSWLRAALYDAETARLLDRQRAVFVRLYPNAATPPAVRRWLESEALRMAGVSGAAGTMPQSQPALETLRQVTAGLPKGLKLRILDLRIEPAEVFIEGQARNHADAETVARGIAQQGSFVMEPPRTENLVKGGVAFTLAGKPAAPSAKPLASAGTPAAKTTVKAAASPAPAAQPKGGKP